MEWSGTLFQRSAKHLVGFLTLVVAEFGRSECRVAAASYVQRRLLMPGQRKSVEPMAARLARRFPRHFRYREIQSVSLMTFAVLYFA